MTSDQGNRDILFVCSDLHVGGTERQLVALAAGLIALGWRVAVYSLAGPGALQAELESAGANVILPPVKRPRSGVAFVIRIAVLVLAVPHLARIMWTRHPAIVHFFLPEAYLVGAPLAAFARVPVRVMSRRSLNLYQRNEFVRRIERLLHRSMNAVLGNSNRIVRELKEEGVFAERLGLIYNGVELGARTSPAARAKQRAALGLNAHALVLCMVANLIPYKGHGDLIDALGHAAARMPIGWHLLLAGHDDGIGIELKARAERAGIGDHVSLLGMRRDVPALLASSDAFVLCSHQEGFPNAVLEAMAAGLPTIVTDVGGNPEAVIDGVTGLIVPPHDPERLADAIVQLANDPAKRAAFGSAGVRRVGEHFTMERCVALHDALYRTLLAGGKPAAVAAIAVKDRPNPSARATPQR